MDEYTASGVSTYAKDAYAKGYEQGKKDAVKHGYWLEGNNEVEYVCSRCDAADYTRSKYCWNCGAKMDGKNE